MENSDNNSTPVPLNDVKQEQKVEIVDDVKSAGTEDFDDETMDAYDMLRDPMQRDFFSVYTAPFHRTKTMHRDLLGEDLEEAVNPVVSDPSYNNRQDQNRENAQHDQLTNEDMETMVAQVKKILVRGGNAVLFCPAFLFRHLVLLLVREDEKVEDHDLDDP